MEVKTQEPKDYYSQQFDRKYGEFATKFQFGSNPSAEIWNGRLAMIGFLAALIFEVATGQNFVRALGLM
ncbi:MAG: hypothetical protein N5P05_000185 [Chroococcopsis gigantea SAG 12.99]|jgi:hypothetical protein|nr:chlorophyll A-B binding protein [Chlorogloea purpurea SAG 13.99]MDV2998579.1 hypothetical protein [Chroococcopsis gigantea SAG 12.99]